MPLLYRLTLPRPLLLPPCALKLGQQAIAVRRQTLRRYRPTTDRRCLYLDGSTAEQYLKAACFDLNARGDAAGPDIGAVVVEDGRAARGRSG